MINKLRSRKPRLTISHTLDCGMDRDTVCASSLNSFKQHLRKLYQDGSFHRLLQSVWPKRLSQFPLGRPRLVSYLVSYLFPDSWRLRVSGSSSADLRSVARTRLWLVAIACAKQGSTTAGRQTDTRSYWQRALVGRLMACIDGGVSWIVMIACCCRLSSMFIKPPLLLLLLRPILKRVHNDISYTVHSFYSRLDASCLLEIVD